MTIENRYNSFTFLIINKFKKIYIMSELMIRAYANHIGFASSEIYIE